MGFRASHYGERATGFEQQNEIWVLGRAEANMNVLTDWRRNPRLHIEGQYISRRILLDERLQGQAQSRQGTGILQ